MHFHKKGFISSFIRIGVFFLLPVQMWAQKDDQEKADIIGQRIETMAENNTDQEMDYTTLFDQLSLYFDRPLNLNNARMEELQQLRLLNDHQILAFFDHIHKNGKLIAIYELQTIKGWDMATIYQVLPFVKVSTALNNPHISFKDLLEHGSHTLFLRSTRILEEQEGFASIEDSTLAQKPESRYLGDANQLYVRYRFHFQRNISWGFTAEKDAGEAFFKGTQKQGFDFYSAHLYWKGRGKIRALALGDYQVQFGQGLSLWSGLSFGKSAVAMQVKKHASGLRPYTSVDENRFMRGGGITVGLNDFELTGFYSRKRIDANIDTTHTLENKVVVSSFQTSGIHGTPGQLFDKDAIGEQHFGGHFAYKKRRLNIGITAMGSRYEGDVQRNLRLYNRFDLNTNSNVVMGTDYQLIASNVNVFGEISRSKNGGMAMLNGVLIVPDPHLSFSLLHRRYDKDYQQLLGAALAESSRPQNEHGFYVGMEIRPNRRWLFNGYFDIFTFPWMQSTVSTPNQNGHAYLARLNWKPYGNLEMYVQVRQRQRPMDASNDRDYIHFIVLKEQTGYRFNVSAKASDELHFKSRFEWVKYKEGDQPSDLGYLLSQDLIYRKAGKPLRIHLRYALFHTGSYNSRIYSYENDVLYFYSIPAYAYRGSRYYVVLRYQLIRNVDGWLRLARFAYNNRDVQGSGLHKIKGSNKTEIKVQLRFKF